MLSVYNYVEKINIPYLKVFCYRKWKQHRIHGFFFGNSDVGNTLLWNVSSYMKWVVETFSLLSLSCTSHQNIKYSTYIYIYKFAMCSRWADKRKNNHNIKYKLTYVCMLTYPIWAVHMEHSSGFKLNYPMITMLSWR